MSEPTIYKRPNLYNSNAQKRYSCYNGLGVYKLPYGTPQSWTNSNVPAGVQTVHDFGDGLGPVPAIPTDAAGIRNDIICTVVYPVQTDSCGVRNDIVATVVYPVQTDSCGVRNDIISAEIVA